MIPRTCKQLCRPGLFLALALAAGTSSAVVPEPDAVVHGRLFHRFDQRLTPTQPGEITVFAQVNGTTIATNLVAFNQNTFLLRVPMDDGLVPRLPGTAAAGDQVRLFIRNNRTSAQFECVQTISRPWTVPPGRGPVVSMNLAVAGNVTGVAPDADRNGLPDFWDHHFSIVAPKPGQRCGVPAFTLLGTADGSLGTVWYQLNGATWAAASSANGGRNWMADVTLSPGANVLRVYAADAGGNYFPTNEVTFYYEPAPFAAAAGNFAGLFYDTSNGVTVSNAGSITLTVTKDGKFTAKLRQGAKNYPFSGQFSQSGAWNGAPIKGDSSLAAWLQLNMSSGDEITGQISNQVWAAEIRAYQMFYANTKADPQAGQYTLVIPGNDDAANLPAGDGAAAVSVTSSGQLKVSGILGDGTPVTAGTFVSKHGQWPLYSSLYSNKGILIGWLTFTNDPATASDMEGAVGWIKPGQTGTALYPNGFDWPFNTQTNNVFGSEFVKRTPLLNWLDGFAVLEYGNLARSITNAFVMSNGGKGTGPTGFTLTVTTAGAKAGLFKGSVLDPATGKVIAVKGALFQKQDAGYGSFLGTSQSGRVRLRE